MWSIFSISRVRCAADNTIVLGKTAKFSHVPRGAVLTATLREEAELGHEEALQGQLVGQATVPIGKKNKTAAGRIVQTLPPSMKGGVDGGDLDGDDWFGLGRPDGVKMWTRQYGHGAVRLVWRFEPEAGLDEGFLSFCLSHSRSYGSSLSD